MSDDEPLPFLICVNHCILNFLHAVYLSSVDIYLHMQHHLSHHLSCSTVHRALYMLSSLTSRLSELWLGTLDRTRGVFRILIIIVLFPLPFPTLPILIRKPLLISFPFAFYYSILLRCNIYNNLGISYPSGDKTLLIELHSTVHYYYRMYRRSLYM